MGARNIIIAVTVLILFSLAGVLVLRRLGLRLPSGNPSDTTPLDVSPQPTFVPFASPTAFPYINFATPVASSTPVSRINLSPTPSAFQCAQLIVEPASGTAPLVVKFSVSGRAVGIAREYEFDFGDTEKLKQTTTTLSHTYKNAGTYVAALIVRDSSGNIVDIGECRETISVKAKPEAVATNSASNLPKTGLPLGAWITLLPVAGIGIWLFRRYKLV